MITMHTLLYKYKKYASEMIADVNFGERIKYLRDAEENNLAGDAQSSKECMENYDVILKGEKADIDTFTMKL